MGRRVLVTGAQGFLGVHLVGELIDSDPDTEVLGLGRSPRRRGAFTHFVHWGTRSIEAPHPARLGRANRSDRYRYRSVDLLDRPALIQLLQEFRPDWVLHMAASLRDEPTDSLLRNNVAASASLVEAIAGASLPEPPRVVFGSSGAVYGAPTRLPIREGDPCRPLDPYSASKRSAEEMCRVLCEVHDIPGVIARIFNPVGPGQDERHLCGWLGHQIAAIRAGESEPRVMVGSLDSSRDYVDARDTARAITTLARDGAPGHVYNVASGRETKGHEIFALLVAEAGVGDRIEITPRPARRTDVPRYYADVGALRALGYEPAHELVDSLRDVLAYYRDRVAPLACGATAPASRAARRGELRVRAERRDEYEVEVRCGLLDQLPRQLDRRFPSTRMVVLTDDTVASLHAKSFLDRLRTEGVDAEMLVLPAGESSKALRPYEGVIEGLHRHRFERRSLLVNFGGGLITDVGGFVASTYMRGVSYVNVPTTLLAQHDSAIGGKVAVNTGWAKNFVGAFHHPRGVYVDPTVLSTLSRRDVSAGIAESIKVGMAGTPDLFRLLEETTSAVLDERDAEILERVVWASAARKIELLDPDPYERDLRRVLNLGHTFGHALETELGYQGILHGEAVGFGIAVATAIAEQRGLCRPQAAKRVYHLLARYELPLRLERGDLEAAIRHLDPIRLVRGGHLHFVLPTDVGTVKIVQDVADDEVRDAIQHIARQEDVGSCVRGSLRA